MMKYDRNNTEHGSFAQKSIWHCIRMLAPLHKVVIRDNTSFPEVDLLLGQEQFYSFIKGIYEKMYEDPTRFLVPTAAYDEYIKTAKTTKGAEKAHYTDTKECGLRNTFQQAILFYAKFFYELGLKAEGLRNSDYALIITRSELEEVHKLLEGTHLRQGNQGRYTVLKEQGIETEQTDEICYIYNKEQPKMFLGLWVFCSAPQNAYKYMNYLRLDYQGCQRKAPDIQDIVDTLDEDHGRVILKVQGILINLDVKIKVKPPRSIASGFKWKVEYSHKGKSVFGFYAAPGELMLCIYFNSAQNITEVAKQLQECDGALFQWFAEKIPERLCKCPNNRRVAIGNEKRRICGLSNRAEVKNPEEIDVDNCIRVLKLFRKLK